MCASDPFIMCHFPKEKTFPALRTGEAKMAAVLRLSRQCNGLQLTPRFALVREDMSVSQTEAYQGIPSCQTLRLGVSLSANEYLSTENIRLLSFPLEDKPNR